MEPFFCYNIFWWIIWSRILRNTVKNNNSFAVVKMCPQCFDRCSPPAKFIIGLVIDLLLRNFA